MGAEWKLVVTVIRHCGKEGVFKMRFLKILRVENGLIVMSAERLL